MNMPKIDTSKLTGAALWFAKRIVASKGKNNGRLRASKPPVDYTPTVRNGRPSQEPTMKTGAVAYVWRMVAFVASPLSQHQCMPVTADFDLPGDYDKSRRLAKRLDKVADAITNAIDKSEWHGIHRWGRAMGAF